MSEMKRWGILFVGMFVSIGATSCLDFPLVTTKGGVVAPQTNKDEQSLCDVRRNRARIETLQRTHIDRFREVALKISKMMTEEDVSSLVDLFPPGAGSLDPEFLRQRNEIVSEIYTKTINRAGYTPPESQPLSDTGLSVTIGVDPVSSSDDRYTEFLVGRLANGNNLSEGDLYQVSLAADPRQDRYFVRLYLFSRYDVQADGTSRPILTSESLFDYATEQTPRSCDGVPSALDLDAFNTIPGLGYDGSIEADPLPAPVSTRVPAPSPAVSPSPAPSASPTPALGPTSVTNR